MSCTCLHTQEGGGYWQYSTVKALENYAAHYLGYQELKDLQMKVITRFVSGHNVFAILPTGFGKSLCYACLPPLFDHLLQPEELSIVIVVTPLLAIMEDHVSTFSFYCNTTIKLYNELFLQSCINNISTITFTVIL